jgi:hypothetical protein
MLHCQQRCRGNKSAVDGRHEEQLQTAVCGLNLFGTLIPLVGGGWVVGGHESGGGPLAGCSALAFAYCGILFVWVCSMHCTLSGMTL